MLVLLSRYRRKGAWSSRGHREYRSHPKKCASEEEVEKKKRKSSMAEQNGRTKTKTAAVAATGTAAAAAAMTVNGGAGVGGSEFVEGWTLAQTLGEGAYGE